MLSEIHLVQKPVADRSAETGLFMPGSTHIVSFGDTDRDGFYGIVRFAEAARAHGLATVFGAELTITELMQEPSRLVVLARGPEGYARLARAISTAQLAGSKGDPRITLAQLAETEPGLSGLETLLQPPRK